MDEDIMWVGLDAHKAFLQVAVLAEEASLPLSWRVEHTTPQVKKLRRKRVKLANGREIRVCYEAGALRRACIRGLAAPAPLGSGGGAPAPAWVSAAVPGVPPASESMGPNRTKRSPACRLRSTAGCLPARPRRRPPYATRFRRDRRI